MSECFADFLDASFDALRRELPEVYAALCRHFGSRQVGIRVADEEVGVRFEPQAVHVGGRLPDPAIEVETSKADILALVDAARTLVDSVLADALVLRGSPDDLLVFHDGLMIYLHGAVRAPSFPPLLRAYRGVAADSTPAPAH